MKVHCTEWTPIIAHWTASVFNTSGNCDCFIMTAGVCEVEIENVNVFSGDSSCKFVGGSDEVIGGGGRMVECSALGTNFIVLGSAIAKEGESGAVFEDSVNIHLDVSHGEIGQVSATTCEVEKLNGFEDLGDVVLTVKVSDVFQTVEDLGDVVQTVEELDDVVKPVEDSCYVVQTVVDSGDVVQTVEHSGFANDPVENGDTEVTIVDEDAKSWEQVKGNPEFIIQDIEFLELDVKSEDRNKENVEIIDDDIESQIVVIDDVQNTCNQDVDSEFQQLFEIDDNKESKMLVMKNVEDTPSSDDDITQSVMAEHEQETEASNYPITYHTTISQVEIDFPDVNDEKQTEEFEVKENPIVPKLIFPDSLVSPDITMQFGSFSLYKKDQN
ncbi:unnamed protein product [Lactuca saligna]|uniref:Uncharacterized protein n=1 Tax=Lactuca saligna TaxID=75948 RepID=A0AA36A1A2_LACSI|nr:unnamed protein product [Lactuca saligna]